MKQADKLTEIITPKAKLKLTAEEVIEDYRTAYRSRLASLAGWKDVMTAKAKFGIFGDGKEVPQVAMARSFKPGDIRAGYYRDQTFVFASGMSDIRKWFAQLYADSDLGREPASGGRQMNSHFATRMLDSDGRFTELRGEKHTSADLSPTSGQMARMVGLAYASKLYRNVPALAESTQFSDNGNEVVFGTVGNASTSEGVFWEAVNAVGVLQVPLMLSVWDDEYGISVPNEFQTVKSSISQALAGMQYDSKKKSGLDIYTVKGWDYLALCDLYALASAKIRKTHIPALIHVVEVTQPQGHSTSGSHERYKSSQRLDWEVEFDGNRKMRDWMITSGVASDEILSEIEAEDDKFVADERIAAWEEYTEPMRSEQTEALRVIDAASAEDASDQLNEIIKALRDPPELNRKLIQASLVRAAYALRGSRSPAAIELRSHLARYRDANNERYNSFLYSQSDESPLKVEVKPATYSKNSEVVDGRKILVRCFDSNMGRDSRIFAIGEDIGKLGGVNLAFEGLQDKHGEERVTDTGIREATIFGQGMGAAMRGLKPLVDIQYLDYLLFAIQGISDDLASLHWRTAGGQKAPVIIRTKGHRLQGVWHTGSPMSMVLNAARGIYLCVPRDMTQAAGMYNTLFRSDAPAIVVEVLAGYRMKEKMPDNVGTFTVGLGVPEILRTGGDVTIVTYGAMCKIALEAAADLEKLGIESEVIDVQTLNPFDLSGMIVGSLRKTNAVVFADEDVPGGATAYMMQEALERQGGWQWLDAPPRTLPAKENRSAFATDGDYFTKPNREDIVDSVYSLMAERRPYDFPSQ